MKRILFVCLGNICRSPLAQGIMESLLEGEPGEYEVDSAATSGYHNGQLADHRAIRTAQNHSLNLTHISRKILPVDFEKFDYILVMDSGIRQDVVEMMQKWGYNHPKIFMMRDFDDQSSGLDVADPYYGNQEDFESCYQLLYECCRNFLAALKCGL